MPYERLVSDLKAAAEAMLEHCGMPWDDAVLHFHQTQRTVHTASLAQVSLETETASLLQNLLVMMPLCLS